MGLRSGEEGGGARGEQKRGRRVRGGGSGGMRGGRGVSEAVRVRGRRGRAKFARGRRTATQCACFARRVWSARSRQASGLGGWWGEWGWKEGWRVRREGSLPGGED